jgi:uncharacterized phage infection (PIP) family protein YhgE
MSTSTQADQGGQILERQIERPQNAPIHTEVAHVPYRFSVDELLDLNTDFRAKLKEIESIEDEAKQQASDFKNQIKRLRTQLDEMETKLDSGEEKRPMKVRVEFDPSRGKKRYYSLDDGDHVGEEAMTQGDWQLPMFKQDKNGNLEPVKTAVPAPVEETEPTTIPVMQTEGGDNAGVTSVGDVLDAAASLKEAPLIEISLSLDWQGPALIREFRKCAKKAKWNDAQISLMVDLLKDGDSVTDMKDTLRPHVQLINVETADQLAKANAPAPVETPAEESAPETEQSGEPAVTDTDDTLLS